MSVVVVERAFREPVEFAAIQALEDQGATCLEALDVRFVVSYFSRDRRRMICVYDAPDAEAVRIAQRRAGVPFETAWPAHVVRLEALENPDRLVVVERRLEAAVDEAGVHALAGAGAGCLEAHGCRFLASYLAPDGRRTICLFEGPDAESVRSAQRRLHMPFDAAWPSTVHAPPPSGRAGGRSREGLGGLAPAPGGLDTPEL
jgi:hypothetical protein